MSKRNEFKSPVESASGEYLVDIRILASCDGCDDSEISRATIEKDAIEESLTNRSDRVVFDSVLPDDGSWIIECRGALYGQDRPDAIQSMRSTIELASKETKEQTLARETINSLDEQARQNAGDIQSTIRKLRGPCSVQMTSESKYSFLNTTVVRGRSTLNALKSLAEENSRDEDYVPGIATLSGALAEAIFQ